MAARRLVIVMLVLLGISTLAAALVPPPDGPSGSSTDTTSPRTSELPPGGEFLRASIDADSPRAERIEIPLGDQLELQVRSRRAGEVEIPGLGLLEDVAPGSAARFDILARRPGRFEVRRIEPAARLGVIDVSVGDARSATDKKSSG